jgi:LCP family protein required for cell wall assembly
VRTDGPGTPGEFTSGPAGASDAAGTPDAPSMSDAPSMPDAPSTPEAAGIPDAPNTPEASSMSDDPNTPEAAGTSEAPNTSELPGIAAPAAAEDEVATGTVPVATGEPVRGGKHRRGRNKAEETAAIAAAGPVAAGTAAGGRKRRRWVKRTVIGVSAVVVLALVVGAAGWFYLNYRLGEIPKVHVKGLVKPPAKPGGPFNMLLVGSDSRSFCTTAVCQSHLGNQGASGGQRSDVIIIMRVVPATKSIYMLSIPRDTWVTLAESGGQGNRINAAFNNGPDQLVATIEQDFHIPINHYAYANFLGFSNAVSALGGVWMNFHYRVRDFETGLRIHKTGCQYLNGTESLQLVRSRDLQYWANGQWNYDGLGDLSRIRRQEAFFHAVIDKARTDYNPLSINAFIASAVKDIEVDDTFTTTDLRNLAFEFHSMSSNHLHTEVIPTMGAVTSAGQDILLPVWKLDREMIAHFLRIGGKKSAHVIQPASSSSTTTTTQAPVTGTTTAPIIDNDANYPEPWNPVPCNP